MQEKGPNSGTINQLITWAATRESIRAMLLTSTRARPQGVVDQLSDYDVILIVRDILPFFEDRSWVTDFGDVLVSYWDTLYPNPDYGLDQFTNVIQYADGLRIDFTLWPVALLRQMIDAPALPAELDAGYTVLLDKDQLTDGMAQPTYQAYIPTKPTAETFQLMIEEFFSDAPAVAKFLWRDDLFPAKWCLDHDMKHVYLRRFLEWKVGCDYDWTVPTEALGKGLKKQLPAEIWFHLERCYAGTDLEENWAALFETMALFRRVALDVAACLGFAYPHDLDQRVTAYVQCIKDLARPPAADSR